MEYQNLQSSLKRKNNLAIWLLIILFFIAGVTLVYFLMDLQHKLDYSMGKFDAALDTISQKNEELKSFQSEIENANSHIFTLSSENESLYSEINSKNSKLDSLTSEINTLTSEIDTLNSKIASLSKVKISRVDIVNENCNNEYVFLDGRLAGGTRGDGHTYFYIPPGSHEFEICIDPYRSSCSSKKTYDVSKEVFTFTITKHTSCP